MAYLSSQELTSTVSKAEDLVHPHSSAGIMTINSHTCLFFYYSSLSCLLFVMDWSFIKDSLYGIAQIYWYNFFPTSFFLVAYRCGKPTEHQRPSPPSNACLISFCKECGTIWEQHTLLAVNEEASEFWPSTSPCGPQHGGNTTHGVDAKLEKR